jgi:diguanylate cyclase (GGDEF)-like protein/PAS domain S-box-containing protein
MSSSGRRVGQRGTPGYPAYAIHHDVSAVLVAELERARAELERYRALFEQLPDAAFSLDTQGRLTDVNAACARLVGGSAVELIGSPIARLVADADAERTMRHVAAALAGETQSWTADLRSADGLRSSVEITAIPVQSAGGVVGVHGVARDITQARVMEEQLTHQAFHDPLTGLANRLLFRDRVERALTRAALPPSLGGTPIGMAAIEPPVNGAPADGVDKPLQGRHLAVLFIDLDDLKTTHDSLGHAEGDRLLEEVAARLLKATRGFDLVARLGGDEFGVLLEGMMRETDAQAVIDRIKNSLKRPITLADREVIVGASLGVAHARDAASADELLRNADVAMYQAKTAGKGRHAEFDHAMHAAAVARLELAADLRFAVDRDELRLMYQPVVELANGAVVGAEALVRWERPKHGLVPPLSFIPLAEETGLIVPIGRWVLREACLQLARWRASLPGGESLTMNVNVSGRQLDDPAFAADVRAVLDETKVPPSQITLEITESVLMQRADGALAALHSLKAIGVSLAIDDFGTGYSSLGYLQRFPVDVLKIDRAFVDGVARGGSTAALARTIVALGDALGLRAVAEGVEQEVQQTALAALGCRLGQGYLFARPLPPADFVKRFAANPER